MINQVKIGDVLWSVQLGRCEVIQIEEGARYPITARSLEGNPKTETYSLSGRRELTDIHQSLFLKRPSSFPPPVKNVLGFAVPDVALTSIEEGASYIMPAPSEAGYITPHLRVGSLITLRLQRGLVYPTTLEGGEAAEIHAKAMLGEGTPYENRD